MLVIQFKKEILSQKRQNKMLFNKSTSHSKERIVRQNIKINDRLLCFLSISKNDISNHQVQRLLNVYKGRILVPREYKNLFEADMLFNVIPFFQKALVSSLTKQLAYVDADKRNLLIKVDDFKYFDEFSELVKLSKKVAFCTENCPEFEFFQSSCYKNFGAIVLLKDYSQSEDYGIIMDLNSLDEQGKLIIDFFGKHTLIYPDAAFFGANEAVQKLVYMGIDEKTASAAADYLGVR